MPDGVLTEFQSPAGLRNLSLAAACFAAVDLLATLSGVIVLAPNPSVGASWSAGFGCAGFLAGLSAVVFWLLALNRFFRGAGEYGPEHEEQTRSGLNFVVVGVAVYIVGIVLSGVGNRLINHYDPDQYALLVGITGAAQSASAALRCVGHLRLLRFFLRTRFGHSQTVYLVLEIFGPTIWTILHIAPVPGVADHNLLAWIRGPLGSGGLGAVLSAVAAIVLVFLARMALRELSPGGRPRPPAPPPPPPPPPQAFPAAPAPPSPFSPLPPVEMPPRQS